MDMVQTDKLIFEYEKRDEEGNVIGKSRAIDEVDIDVKEGQISAVVLKAVLRVCQSRMYPVHLVQLPKSAFAVLPPFMVAPNHYG